MCTNTSLFENSNPRQYGAFGALFGTFHSDCFLLFILHVFVLLLLLIPLADAVAGVVVDDGVMCVVFSAHFCTSNVHLMPSHVPMCGYLNA